MDLKRYPSLVRAYILTQMYENFFLEVRHVSNDVLMQQIYRQLRPPCCTFVTEEGDSIRRNAESTRLEQVRPSSASKSPKGHLQTALGPGANTHMWEHFFTQGLSALV